MSSILKKLREQRGYSQEQLSKELKISRQSLINYEKGEYPTIENLKKLADFFEISYDCIIDNKEPVLPTYNIIASGENKTNLDVRINIPQENIEKFKQVLLYILSKVGAKPNVGQTVVYKLLYFIDFDYYELFETQLMGLKYIKNNYGPTPVDFAKIIKKMQKDGEIEEVNSKFFDKAQKKYLPLVKPKLSLLSAQELEHIDKELDKLSDMTAKELSDLSHKDIPWIGVNMGALIEYEAVFYRTEKTSVRKYSEDND